MRALKRALCTALWLLLLLLPSAALGETAEIGGRLYLLQRFTRLPAEMQNCLDALTLTPQQVTQGLLAVDTGPTGDRVYARHALLVVADGEDRLLVSCERLYSAEGIALDDPDEGAVWISQPLSRRFLRAEAPALDYAAWPQVDAQRPWFVLGWGEERYYLDAGISGGSLGGYARAEEGGGTLVIDSRISGRLLVRRITAEGRERAANSYSCGWLNSLSEADIGGFPTTAEEAAAWARSHPVTVDTRLRLIGSMNLRQQATARSPAIAVYNYPVLAEWIDEAEGLVEPWVRVRVGSEMGWVSASYVHGLHEAAYLPVANGLPLLRADGVLQLYDGPDGEALDELPAGTVMHRLTEWRNGWAQVCVPREEAGYWMDSAGAYGWVAQGEALTEAFNWLDMVYRK